MSQIVSTHRARTEVSVRLPSKDILRSRGQGLHYAGPLHPIPKFYKHYWQIFTLDSQWEGEEFLQLEPHLSTAACMRRLEELRLSGEPYMLYGGKRPRKFLGMPFDPASERWRNANWAPALEDDSDPEWNGHR